MQTRQKHHRMNQDTFTKIKNLRDAGLSSTQTAKFCVVSVGTVRSVDVSKNLEDYQKRIKESNEYYKNKRLAKAGIPVPCAPTQEAKSQPSETPIYDVLVEILTEMKTLNQMISAAGKSKTFRLW